MLNSLRLRARQQKSAEKVAIKRLLPAPHWMNWDLLPLTICRKDQRFLPMPAFEEEAAEASDTSLTSSMYLIRASASTLLKRKLGIETPLYFLKRAVAIGSFSASTLSGV